MQNKIITLISGVLLAALIVGYINLRPAADKTEKIFLGYRGEAQYNPFFAVERFIHQLGIAADSLPGINWAKMDLKNHHNDVLIVATARDNWSEQSRNVFFDWVASGGRMIIDPVVTWDSDLAQWSMLKDPILEALNVYLDLTSGKKNNPQKGVDQGQNKALIAVKINNTPVQFQLDNLISYRLGTNQDVYNSLQDAYGNLVLQFSHGKGFITVVNDVTIFTNDNLAKKDHAEFLRFLLLDQVKPARVWIIYGQEMPTLLALLWEKAWMVFYTLLVLLVLWLTKKSFGFGPLLPADSLSRRRLMEHIEASGIFLWRHKHSASIIATLRAHIFQVLHHKKPGWAFDDAIKLNQQLADHTQLSPLEIATALQTPPDHQAASFIKTFILLERIRKNL